MTDKMKLLALLRDRGPRGIHTSELRVRGISGNPSSRRLDLIRDGYVIRSERESYIGADGKSRPGARFFLDHDFSDAGLGADGVDGSPAAPEVNPEQTSAEPDAALFDLPDPEPPTGSYRDPDGWAA